MASLDANLRWLADRIAAIPLVRDPESCPRVLLTGDFFTRFSSLFMEGIRERYAEQGIVLKPADLGELVLYGTYDAVAGTAEEWGLKPGGLALVKACTRFSHPDGKLYLGHWLSYRAERRVEEHYRSLFRGTGLLAAGNSGIPSAFERASEHVSPRIFGEVIPTVGTGLQAETDGYDGVIVVGPFNCLPYRISEAILRPIGIQRGVPTLTYESDGYPVPASVLKQVDVHIQQVLEHARGRQVRHRRQLRSIGRAAIGVAPRARNRPGRPAGPDRSSMKGG
jgi:hypothetical protein